MQTTTRTLQAVGEACNLRVVDADERQPGRKGKGYGGHQSVVSEEKRRADRIPVVQDHHGDQSCE